MLERFPKDKWIHVNSEEEGQIVIDYYSEFGYRRTRSHSEYRFMQYPYLCEYGDFKISGHSCMQDRQNTLEFADWWSEVTARDFEPAESSSLDALLGVN